MFRTGDLVEVRSREEILATLDALGRLDNLPFMPEMLRFCGRRMRVSRAAHKTCDSATYSGGRYMRDAVFLEDARCDGAAHAGCQARCLIFWKAAWLKAVSSAEAAPKSGAPVTDAPSQTDAIAAMLDRATRADVDGEVRYRCQATEHLAATTPLRGWAPWHFIRDVRSGNARVRDVLRVTLLAAIWQLRNVGIGWRLSIALYDRVHRALTGGVRDPFRCGQLPEGQGTPDVRLGLQPGEWVEVLSHDRILATLNTRNRNRGLAYNPELTPFCGQRHRVEQRVTRIIEESSGRMLTFQNACITLEGVYCRAHYTHYSLLCSRKIVPYFREAWLTRAGQAATDPAGTTAAAAASMEAAEGAGCAAQPAGTARDRCA